jgi:glutamate racemase
MSSVETRQVPSIAFFDSGQGGLTVWESIRMKFPQLNTLYLGDNARYPYGNKGAATVTRYSSEAAYFFSSLGAGLIVVACGTASSMAVSSLQKVFRIPVVGIVEGFCADAAHVSQQYAGQVAVLGTRFTVASKRFEQELHKNGVQEVWAKACPLFVPLVEEALVPGPLADSACELYLSDMPEDVSVIMLACTHFPRLESSIAQYLSQKTGRPVVAMRIENDVLLQPGDGQGKPPFFLLESSRGIARSVDSFLASQASKHEYFQGYSKVFCTDAPTRFAEVAKVFTQFPIDSVTEVTLGV